MAAEGLYAFLHSALVDIKLSLLHLQCSLFIMLMNISSHWALICLSLLIGMRNPETLLTSLCQAPEPPGVRGNIPEQTAMTDDLVRHMSFQSETAHT